ncbi:hypothetical protein ACLQ3C_13430 [Gordonia sp. DT30]|uniref:hypothetical protein n=1 Tax=unclassified Gordonia (in: high G+C Gram-positive bacteria) TaxID=2657482 RepID=UPI003CEFBA3A
MSIELDRISIGRPPLHVAILGDEPADAAPIVVRRPTLRDAQRARSVLRSGTRDTAGFSVALEVEVAIAPSAASARAAVAGIPDELDGGTVRYVGTPSGLVTLIRDIYAAEVADAVILVPLDGSATDNRLRQLVLPSFAPRRAA